MQGRQRAERLGGVLCMDGALLQMVRELDTAGKMMMRVAGPARALATVARRSNATTSCDRAASLRLNSLIMTRWFTSEIAVREITAMNRCWL